MKTCKKKRKRDTSLSIYSFFTEEWVCKWPPDIIEMYTYKANERQEDKIMLKGKMGG